MWPNLQFPADLVTFTEGILNGKLHFLRSVSQIIRSKSSMIFNPLLRNVVKWSNTL